MMGSLMAELEAREAAARGRAEALRARIAELTEQLAGEEELLSRLGITRQTALEILGGGDDHPRGPMEGRAVLRSPRTATPGFGPRFVRTARSHVPGWRRPRWPRGWVSGWSRCPSGRRAWRRWCCPWPTVTCWKSSPMPQGRCGPAAARHPGRAAGHPADRRPAHRPGPAAALLAAPAPGSAGWPPQGSARPTRLPPSPYAPETNWDSVGCSLGSPRGVARATGRTEDPQRPCASLAAGLAHAE